MGEWRGAREVNGGGNKVGLQRGLGKDEGVGEGRGKEKE